MQAWGLGEDKTNKKKPLKKQSQPFSEHCRGMENQEGVSSICILWIQKELNRKEQAWNLLLKGYALLYFH